MGIQELTVTVFTWPVVGSTHPGITGSIQIPKFREKRQMENKIKKKKLLYKFACFKLWRTAQADQSRHFSHTVTGKYLLLCLTEKPKTFESKIYLLLIHHIQAIGKSQIGSSLSLSTASHFLHLRTANRLFITSHSFFFSL